MDYIKYSKTFNEVEECPQLEKYLIEPQFNHGQSFYRFPNDYGISVICRWNEFCGSYGYEDGLYEVAIFQFLTEDNDDVALVNPFNHYDDVYGYLKASDVLSIAEKVMHINKEKVMHINKEKEKTQNED